MTTRTWHKGPPPHVGWWNASRMRIIDSWRWWDGARWRHAVGETDDIEYVALASENFAENIHQIEWTDYYPEGARVPRIDPRKGGAA